ncbi:MAG: ComEC/Rec2 family competence protein, partial [Planctomycetota bacterium]
MSTDSKAQPTGDDPRPAHSPAHAAVDHVASDRVLLAEHSQPLSLTRQPLTLPAVAAAMGILTGETLFQCGLRVPIGGWMIGSIVMMAWWAIWLLRYARLGSPIGNRKTGWHPSFHPSILASFFCVFATLHGVDANWYNGATLTSVLREADVRICQQQSAVDLPDINRRIVPQWHPTVCTGVVLTAVRRFPDSLAMMRSRRDVAAITTDDETPWMSSVDVQLDSIRVGLQQHLVTGRGRVMVHGDCSDLLPGDRVRLLGEIRRPPPPSNPGEKDPRAIYRQLRLHVQMRVDRREMIQGVQDPHSVVDANGNEIVPDTPWWVWWMRPAAYAGTHSEAILRRHVHRDQSSLASALLLGRRDAVASETRDALVATGTAHLLSVSGMHLGIVATLAIWLSLMVGLRDGKRVLFIIVVCLMFVLLTGARPPVVRAAIVVMIGTAALWLHRYIPPLNTLAMAALVLMAENPLSVTQLGVQLSFLAVSTLVIYGRTSPPVDVDEEAIERLINQTRSKWEQHGRYTYAVLRRLVGYSFWVWAITMPLI